MAFTSLITRPPACRQAGRGPYFSGRSLPYRPVPLRVSARLGGDPSEPVPPMEFGGRTSVHRLIESEGGCLVVPGCFDALSALCLKESNNRAGFISGFGVSATLLGEPDLGILQTSEMAQRSTTICSAVPELPLIADADAGGGGVLAVQRTIRALVASGCKGAVLEDQVHTKSTDAHLTSILPAEEAAAKVCAARAAAGDSDFFLIARTDARSQSAKHGLQDAIRRANLYLESGADAVHINDPRSIYELKQIAASVAGPKVVSMIEGGVTPAISVRELQDMGFNIVLYPLTGVLAVTKALLGAYGGIEAGKPPSSEEIETFDHTVHILGMEEKRAEEQRHATFDGRQPHLRVTAQSRPITAPAPLAFVN